MKAEAAKFADQSSMDEVDMDYGTHYYGIL
jgi:hypothetical protein